MSKNAHRLDVVLGLAQRNEQQEAANLAGLNRKLQEQQQRRDQLLQFGDEYRQQLRSNASDGINAALYKSHTQFINHIQASVDQQDSELRRLENEVSEQTRRWSEANTKVKSLERAIEKDQLQLARKRERVAEIAADEWSQQKRNPRDQEG